MLVRITLLALAATQCVNGFIPSAVPATKVLRGASSIQMQARSSSRDATRGDISRRSFFVKVGAGALTVGALGLEVPQSAVAADLPAVNSPAPDFDLPSNRSFSPIAPM